MILQLLTPQDLPLKQQLSSQESPAVFAALTELEASLELDDFDAALDSVIKLLARLPEPATIESVNPLSDSTLRREEIREFDRYFGVKHIQSDSPSISLIRSLAMSYQAFLELCTTYSGLNPKHVEQQRLGFFTQVQLLRRVFAPGDLS